MEYFITKSSSQDVGIPQNIYENACNGDSILICHTGGLIKKVEYGSTRKLHDIVSRAGAKITKRPNKLTYNKKDEKGEVMSTVKTGGLMQLLGGDFSGLTNFDLNSFMTHVKAAAKRTGKKNVTDSKAGLRRQLGKASLDNLMKDYVMPWLKEVVPGVKIPLLGKKNAINVDDHYEIISIIIGNLAYFGVDVFSYFKIPLTPKAEFITNCMMEYAYQAGMDRLGSWAPKAAGLNKVTNFFDVLELPEGYDKIMTKEERSSAGMESENDKIAEQLKGLEDD